MMNTEEFDIWNEKKKLIHTKGKRPHFYEGDIWWAQIGRNIDTEIHGKGSNFVRPVLIMKRAYGNACIVIPITSQIKHGNYYHLFHDSRSSIQCALLPQIRYIDAKRLMNKISKLSDRGLKLLKRKVSEFL
jgi:mRNA interferase MazF